MPAAFLGKDVTEVRPTSRFSALDAVGRTSSPLEQRPLAGWPASCALWAQRAPMEPHTDKPGWVYALEESLLLAIVLFSLITWIVMIGMLGH